MSTQVGARAAQIAAPQATEAAAEQRAFAELVVASAADHAIEVADGLAAPPLLRSQLGPGQGHPAVGRGALQADAVEDRQSVGISLQGQQRLGPRQGDFVAQLASGKIAGVGVEVGQGQQRIVVTPQSAESLGHQGRFGAR